MYQWELTVIGEHWEARANNRPEVPSKTSSRELPIDLGSALRGYQNCPPGGTKFDPLEPKMVPSDGLRSRLMGIMTSGRRWARSVPAFTRRLVKPEADREVGTASMDTVLTRAIDLPSLAPQAPIFAQVVEYFIGRSKDLFDLLGTDCAPLRVQLSCNLVQVIAHPGDLKDRPIALEKGHCGLLSLLVR